MTWDAMAEVMVVGAASAEESTSLRVLGDRMETGWEHRTRCKGRRKTGMPFPESSHFCSRGFLRPLPSKSQFPQFLVGYRNTAPLRSPSS